MRAWASYHKSDSAKEWEWLVVKGSMSITAEEEGTSDEDRD